MATFQKRNARKPLEDGKIEPSVDRLDYPNFTVNLRIGEHILKISHGQWERLKEDVEKCFSLYRE